MHVLNTAFKFKIFSKKKYSVILNYSAKMKGKIKRVETTKNYSGKPDQNSFIYSKIQL